MRKIILSAVLAMGAIFSTAQAAPVDFPICTGGEGGYYESLGQDIGRSIAKKADVNLEIVNTGGSVENAELLKEGDCVMAIMQADAVSTLPLPADIKVTDSHTEVIYWLFPKNGPVDDFGDMEKDANTKRYAVAVVAGSGAQLTVKNFEATDKDYAGIRYVEFDDWYAAAEAVSQGFVQKAGVRLEIAGMLYIARPGKISSDITEDFGKQIVIGEINDDSFSNSKDINGNPLYTKCSISSKETGGLTTDTIGSPDTYCMRAQVVYNNDTHAGMERKESRAFRRAVDKGVNSIVKAVR